jgi:transposase-like protein
MARLKRSVNKEEFWRLLVEEQQRCGVSIRAFCRQKAISEPSFYAWRKELQKRDAKLTADGGNGRLIPVDVIRPACENATASNDDVKKPLEICTPGGFTLRFDHDTMPETIARLLDVITRCAPGGATSC